MSNGRCVFNGKQSGLDLGSQNIWSGGFQYTVYVPNPRNQAKGNRRDDIQGLRAVAVGAVVMFHAGALIPSGFLGVDVFFVISGFVIGGSVFRRLHSGTDFKLTSFVSARFRRLAPELLLMIGVTLLLTLGLQPELGRAAFFGSIFALLGVSNIYFSQAYTDYFAADPKNDPLLHTWSLGVEEQFYLAFALLLVIALQIRRQNAKDALKLVIIATACLSIFSFLLCLIGWTSLRTFLPYGQGVIGYFSPLSRIWEFGAGLLMAAKGSALKVPKALRFSVRSLHFAGATLLVIVFSFSSSEDTGVRLLATIGAVTGTALLLVPSSQFIKLKKPGPARLLTSRPFVWFGDRSYSIYLWHWPVMVIIDNLNLDGFPRHSGAIVGVLLGLAAHDVVASPLKSIRDLRSPQLASLAVLAGGPVFILTTFSFLLPQDRLSEGQITLTGQFSPTRGQESGCLLERDFRQSDLGRCRFGNTEGWIALVGDSHADALSNAVISAGKSLGLSTLALTGAGCDLSVVAHNEENAVSNCNEMVLSILAEIISEPQASSVIVSETQFGVHAEPVLSEIRRAGIPVIFVRDVPWIRPGLDYGLRDSETGPCILLDGRPICQLSREAAAEVGQRDVESEVLGKMSIDYVLDPWESICDPEFCYGIKGSLVLYLDSHHLNGTGSMHLEPMILDGLRRALSD